MHTPLPGVRGDRGLCRGITSFNVPSGEYVLSVWAGPSFDFVRRELLVQEEKLELSINLPLRCDLRELGYFTGEAHNHLNYPTPPESMRSFLEASDIDMISVGQGWLTPKDISRGHDGKMLSAWLKSFSTPDLSVNMGVELPKTRFGHICWWAFPGLSDPYGLYDLYHDSKYLREAGFSERKFKDPWQELPYEGESPYSIMARCRKEGGVSMAPHPTSWFLENPKAQLICTSISSDYCFDLLGERLYDSLSVMGYDAEQIFFQNLWFHLLNEGYRIAGAAETDGDMRGGHLLGSLRCYVQIGSPKFDMGSFLENLKAGRSFVTSGPILLVQADKKFFPGESITPDGKTHVLNVEAFSAALPREYISWIVLYRNGRVEEIVDVSKEQPRHITHEFKINPPAAERSWYLVKVYGCKHPAQKEFADVMSYAELCEKEPHTEYSKLDQVAFTNPFYFEPTDWKAPAPLCPPMRGLITDAVTKQPIPGARISIFCEGALAGTVNADADGRYEIKSVRLLSEFELSAPGYKSFFRNLYLHYPPLTRYFESVYGGSWAFVNPRLKSGQMPWEAFRFKELKEILSSLNWDFEMQIQ